MTPAQSFHPSFRGDLSTVPSEDEEALATAPAPMEIISHDVNRLVQHLDGMDRQRVAEHEDVKDQLDRVEEELKKLADLVRTEATKPPSPAETVQDLPEPTDDVVMPSRRIVGPSRVAPQAQLWEHHRFGRVAFQSLQRFRRAPWPTRICPGI